MFVSVFLIFDIEYRYVKIYFIEYCYKFSSISTQLKIFDRYLYIKKKF